MRKPSPTVWLRRAVLLANGLALLAGLVLVIAAALFAQEPVKSVLNVIGGALVSAAVVSFALGGITLSETVAQVDSALMRGLQSVLTPVRDPLYAGAWSSYRWDCWLAAAAPDDQHPDYAYQNLRISYRTDTLPSSLRFVCAATRQDRILEDYAAEGYAFRWLVDDHLDVGDPMIFRVGMIRIDNESLRPGAVVSETVPGGRARVLNFPVPKKFRQTEGHTVEYQVLVRKFVGDEERVRVQTNVFRTMTDAEFRLTVDPGLGVNRLFSSATEVSRLGAAEAASCEAMFPEPFDRHAAIVRLPFPLQPGSVIAFTLDRTNDS